MISITTSTKNRSSFLLKVLPSWLNLNNVSEIIIIDYDSTIPFIEENTYNDDRIKIIRVDNKQYYNHSKAKNLRFYHTKNDWVLSLDCDIITQNNIFDEIEFDENIFYRGNKPGAWGSHLIHRNTYLSVNGHNENITGRICDDFDFYKRLKEKGFQEKILKEVYHVQHDNNLRKENLEKDFKGNWGLDNKWEL